MLFLFYSLYSNNHSFLYFSKVKEDSDMELKFDKNNLLKVRLAIVESQLKFANDQIKIIKSKNLKIPTKSLEVSRNI